MLDGVLRDQAGVVGRAARDDDDLVDVAQVLVGQPHLVEREPPSSVEPAEQGVGDGLGLLGDLLEHEVVVAALLGGGDVPVDVEGLAVDGVAGEVGDGVAVGADLDDLVLTELDGVAGVADEGRDVAGEEVLALADAEHQRRVAAGADDDPGRVAVHRDQGEGALEPAAAP